jgi:hypothetical protein
MAKKQTLGIIVNSNKYFSFVIKLADAALGKGKQVRIHLLGPGLEFIKTDACNRLSHLTQMSLCAFSAQQHALQPMDEIETGISLVPPRDLATILQGCYRYVVF